MDTQDPRDPQRPGDEPAGDAPVPDPRPQPPNQSEPDPQPQQPNQPEPDTQPQAGPQSPAGGGSTPTSEPRRLMRSRTDRVLGGVCGGLGRHLGIDPIILRIAALVLLFVGGAGLVAYLAALLLVPSEPIEAAAPGGVAPPGEASRNRTLSVVAVAILLFLTWPILLGGAFLIGGLAIPFALFALVGLAAWLVVSGKGAGDGPGEIARNAALGLGVLLICLFLFAGGGAAAGLGGGAVAAGIVITAGLVLLVGAFTGGLRWLLLPTLALALGVGFVSAAGIDLDGGVGEREYRPASSAELSPEYELGMGELTVDLRDADLPTGDTPLRMRVGMGAATLLVPRDVCVASRAEVGMGAVEVFDRDSGGVDVDWRDGQRAAAATSRVVVDADVGLGAFQVEHEDVDLDRHHRFDDDDHPGRLDRFDEGAFDRGDLGFSDDDEEPGNRACSRGSTASAGGA